MTAGIFNFHPTRTRRPPLTAVDLTLSHGAAACSKQGYQFCHCFGREGTEPGACQFPLVEPANLNVQAKRPMARNRHTTTTSHSAKCWPTGPSTGAPAPWTTQTPATVEPSAICDGLEADRPPDPRVKRPTQLPFFFHVRPRTIVAYVAKAQNSVKVRIMDHLLLGHPAKSAKSRNP